MPKPMPLVMVDRDGVLPGEERDVPSPPLESGAAEALKDLVGEHVVVLCVHSDAFLPTFATQRWGTVCKVLSVGDASVRLRGGRRALVASATTNGPLYPALVERRREAPSEDVRPEELLRAAHLLFAALDAGGTPTTAGWAKRLRKALVRVGSAIATESGRHKLLDASLPEAFDTFTTSLAVRAEVDRGACALEAVLREHASHRSSDDNERLWGQVAEIMKRLGVFDPATDALEGEHQRLARNVMQTGMPKLAMEHAQRQLALLQDMPKNHHDYAHTISQLDLMTRLPWHPEPAAPIDLATVERALDEQHAGLEKPKRRVLEYLAVKKLGGSRSNLVLCLAGPPGVGKTSIAAAIARALGRKLVRVPLGGVHDECEIRGHRLSFIASQPGRIVQGLARARTATALVLLDEIDKMGSDTQRSPSHALLEVLDPEQNHAFQDNYLSVPFDLSHALFIATANDVGRIDKVLLDRLEIVAIDGYTVAEKTAIVRDHLLPRLQREHGLPHQLALDEATAAHLVDGYTREAGVRELERALAAVHRARAVALVTAAASVDVASAPVTRDDLQAALGAPRYRASTKLAELPVGVAIALAVSTGSGTPLYVEVAMMPGNGALQITGNLGEVMRESALTAVAHVRAYAVQYGIDTAHLARDIHVHVPEGATPKEGPSAGIALVAAIVSAATGVPLSSDVAFSGEITLTGRVVAVGGVRAKLLAAERAGIRRVILPEENAADVPPAIAAEVVLVGRVQEAVRAAASVPLPRATAGSEASAASPSPNA